MTRPTTAIVLAAGKGTRMSHPNLPKPLVPVGGRPMLDRVLHGLAASGYERVVLVIGYRGDLVRQHVGSESGGLSVDYAVQEAQEGTAHAVAQAAPLVAQEASILLTWADILVAGAWYEALAVAWAARPGLAGLHTVVEGDPSLGALVEFDDAALMTAFTEKPPGVTRGWADGGVSVQSAEAIAMMSRVEPSPRGEREVSTVVQRLLADGRPIGVERYSGPWCDLASPELVAEAERRFPDLLA